MKNIFLILFLAFSVTTFSQEKKKNDAIKITQKKCVANKGYHLILKKVVADSRCPEGVNCIWAGEIEVIVSVYENKKFLKDHSIILSPKSQKENIAWFSNYYPNTNINSISVLPYPKEAVVLDPKKYYIKIN